MKSLLSRYTLPVGLSRTARHHKQINSSCGFDDSKSFLLFFTSEGNQKVALVKSFQNKLEREGKDVTCLYVVIEDADKPDVHLDEGMMRLTTHDYSLFGKITKPEVLEILRREYDFVIHLDMSCNIYTDIVMAMSKSRCRVGRHIEGHEQQYEMMIHVEEDKKITHLIDQIYQYTKAL